MLILVRQGKDPAAEKEERKRIATELAFDSYALKFLKDYGKPNWRDGTYGNAESNLRRYITPILKKYQEAGQCPERITKLLCPVPDQPKFVSVAANRERLLTYWRGGGDKLGGPGDRDRNWGRAREHLCDGRR
ncbi:MAG: hypothetical protein NVS3B5_03740 [Sphingomicrobium sp.]